MQEISPRPWNRHGLDYAEEAKKLGAPPAPIIDVHTHINGPEAARIFAEVMDLYGIQEVWSMTWIEDVDEVRRALNDRIRLIAVPNFRSSDRRHAFGDDYLDRIRLYHEQGCRIVKFWAAPRSVDIGEEAGDSTLMRLDHPDRIRAMELATSLGMGIMTHIADPDTWFQVKYADHQRYGTKAQQYDQLEASLERFPVPWIAAHMGGWPEDLAFLDGLLNRHPNLHLDTSATKWMIRELSRHPRQELLSFLERHPDRIMFGSDIVSSDDNLKPDEEPGDTPTASSPAEARDLYASRYYALRMLWESGHHGESPIADPDLCMVDPESHGPNDAPLLDGKAMPADTLRRIYHDSASRFMQALT